MNRDEKAQFSKDRILNAAVEEFSVKSYDTASLNNICNENEISKGLLYHYFGNKDDLYLSCVKLCFEKFTDFLEEESYDFSDFQHGMNQYLERRFLFFRTFQQQGHLFIYAVLQPPKHLAEQIQKLKEDFDIQCLSYYKKSLEHITLRDGVSQNDALEYFGVFQELFNGYFNRHIGDNGINDKSDLDELVQKHENQLPMMLNMMLYGIAKRDIGLQ